MEKILRGFNSFNVVGSAEKISITPFKNAEDGENYEVWRITTTERSYVLKKAKNYELEVYSTFFANSVSGAPQYLESVHVDEEDYFLIELVKGRDLCKCDRASLKKALDALIFLQDKYWNASDRANAGFTFEKSLKGRQDRGKYLCDKELEAYYNKFLSAYQALPRTLCHDDLLPFNILVSENSATIIDWEFAGILPYPTSIARLIAHSEENDSAFFYMKDEDKRFAIDYYYDNLVKQKGITYENYRRDLDLFLFYEYCEWIMLGNKYEDADMERYESYLEKAKRHLNKEIKYETII